MNGEFQYFQVQLSKEYEFDFLVFHTTLSSIKSNSSFFECKKIYSCRLCHDEEMNDYSLDDGKRYRMKHYQANEIQCNNCGNL